MLNVPVRTGAKLVVRTRVARVIADLVDVVGWTGAYAFGFLLLDKVVLFGGKGKRF
jgi:hypothetical protein